MKLVDLEKDYQNLVKKALEAREKAYCPYSKFKVGAALITDTNKIYTGANVENASYGLTVCAERNAVFKAVNDGERKIKAIAIVADTPDVCSPCGACRQVIYEFSDEDTIVIMTNLKGDVVVKKIDELLPYGFRFDG